MSVAETTGKRLPERIALGVFAAAYLAWTASLVADPLETYLVKFPDSFDWLTNGLRYAGIPVESTWRAPLNPFVYAGLMAMGLDDAIPFLGPAYLWGIEVVFLTAGFAAVGAAALYAGLFLIANAFVVTHSLVIGSDVLSIGCGVLGLLAFDRAIGGRSAWFLVSAAALMLGYLAQPSTPLLVPACAVMTLVDPEHPRGVSLRPLRRALGDRFLWGGIALALGLLFGAELARLALTGVWWPQSLARPVGWSTDEVGYLAWSSVAAWSWPVAALAIVGVVGGLRDPGRRRVVAGLFTALLAAFAFFAVVYQWRDSRFVLYWTLPALLLAGVGVTTLPRRLRLPALLIAAFWSNLVPTAEISPFEPTIVWTPARTTAMDYHTDALHPGRSPIRPLAVHLGEWIEDRRAALWRPDGEDIYYPRHRAALAHAARAHVGAEETLHLHLSADVPANRRYLIKNQIALYARRRVTVVSLDEEPLPVPDGVAWALLSLEEYRRMRPRLPSSRIVERADDFVLVRFEKS